MEKNDQLLLQLVYMLHTSAMQCLGKIADPTGKLSKNLEYTLCRFCSIDYTL